jgi:Uma2 family endonuclease
MVAQTLPLKKTRLPKQYTFAEYLRREARAKERHEFYNGKIVLMPGGTDKHSEISANVISALKVVVRPLPLKYRVYSSDLKIYIEPADSSVYADAFVICEQPIYWENRRDIITNPLLIIEILSPSTRSYDRLGKFELYKMLPSFREYVLVNADKPSVETRFLEEADLWRIKTETILSHQVLLKSLNTSISMEDIYENIDFEVKK